MATFEEFKAQLEAQSAGLDAINVSITGIAADVTYLKTLASQNPNGLTAEQVSQLSVIADSLTTKINEIGATTASLDAATTIPVEETPVDEDPVI